VAAEIGKGGTRKVTTHRVDVGEPAQIQEFSNAALPPIPAHIVIKQCRGRTAGAFNEVDRRRWNG